MEKIFVGNTFATVLYLSVWESIIVWHVKKVRDNTRNVDPQNICLTPQVNSKSEKCNKAMKETRKRSTK
jgi:hypothetical protein